MSDLELRSMMMDEYARKLEGMLPALGLQFVNAANGVELTG